MLSRGAKLLIICVMVLPYYTFYSAGKRIHARIRYGIDCSIHRKEGEIAFLGEFCEIQISLVGVQV